MSTKPQTKQQKYKQKMRGAGFSCTEVYAHKDDKLAIQEFARMLRNKRDGKKAA